MDYNLAKKLKDSGFPQKGNGVFGCEHGGHNPTPKDCWEAVYYPTLEELIAACGKGFEGIIPPWVRNMNCWRALGKIEWMTIKKAKKYPLAEKEKGWGNDNKMLVSFTQDGETLIEAVANLYLALHEK